MNTPPPTTSNARCDVCGAALPPDAPLGQCPACLMDSASDFGFGDDDGAMHELPRQCGEYELLRQIGYGGMGLVYEARQTRLKQRVALKMIRPDLASKKFLRRFLIEGEAAARLDHPNIIPIYEIKEDGPESFFSMQFIEGETLKEKLRTGELGLPHSSASLDAKDLQRRQIAIARLIAQVARAVHHAHERGVFHRDLKPANILVDADGQPHIADFGVAKIIEDEARAEAESALTAPGATLGTPEYMSPEQASGTAFNDAAAIGAADVYSLGAILYELLTGRPPFRGSSHLETLQKVREADLKCPRSINPGVARDLETIALKCLEKNPQARYASAGAVADDLERWIAGKAIIARPASAPVRVQRWVKRNPAGTALIVSLFFGLGAALSFVAVLADRMRTAEIRKAQERDTYIQIINERWAMPAISNLPIPSALLAEIRNDKIRPAVDQPGIRLRLGMSVDQDPITHAHNVASVIGELESGMKARLGTNVFIDLFLAKASPLDTQLLVTRDADFQRLDALAYVQARGRDPGITPIAIENDADDIVFCVMQDSGITNVIQLAGRSVGFGDRDSAATVLAQSLLLAHGLGPSDLKAVVYSTNLFVVSTTRLPEFGSAEIMTDLREVKSGREALRFLLQGKVDAAATLKRYYETRRHRGGGMRMIARIPGTPEVFAARAGLEPTVAHAFGQALLSLKQSPGLAILSSFRTVSGVILTNDSYFDSLRVALTNVQQQFHGPETAKLTPPKSL